MLSALEGLLTWIQIFIKRSIHSLTQLCIYSVKLYDTVDVRHKKCTTHMLAKLQMFKIHMHTCSYKASECYSSGTHPLKGWGCDKFYTEQTGTTN